jgi:hypothetical protein
LAVRSVAQDGCCRRHSSGETPTHLLNARLKAASDSKPTAAATVAILEPSSASSRLASCMIELATYVQNDGSVALRAPAHIVVAAKP